MRHSLPLVTRSDRIHDLLAIGQCDSAPAQQEIYVSLDNLI